MPIRTRRGRAAAYRAVWEWPLRSPARLLGVLAVLVAGAVGLSSLLGGGSPASRPAPTDRAGAVVTSAPPLELTPQRLPPSAAPPAALATAERWTRAWTTHPPGTTPAQWTAGLRPFTTEEYLPTLAAVDPANVPGRTVVGPPAPVEVHPDSVRVAVPTDAVRLELLVVRTGPADWRVAGYDRTS